MKTILAAVFSLFIICDSSAQDISAFGHVGTLGIGADVSVGFDAPVSVRAGFSAVPFSVSFSTNDIDFDANLPSTRLSLIGDFNIPSVPLRLSAGITRTGDDYELVATPTENITIGDVDYTPAEVGTLTGLVTTQEVSPYLGIGIGQLPVSGVGFTLDLGVLFHGEPEVGYEVDGALANDADFLIELEKERVDLQDDLSSVKIFPVLKIGASFGL